MNEPQTSSRLDRLLRFLGADPKNPQLLADALQLAQAEGDAEKAAVLLAHVEKYGVPNPVVAAHAALLHLQLGQPGPAARYGEDALAAGLDEPTIRLNTAWAQLYNGDHGRVDALLAPLSQGDVPPETLVLHSRALHHLERPEEAKALLTRALQAAPEHAEALGMLALLEQEDDHHDSAIALAQKALLHDPDQRDALLALAECYFEQDNLPESRAWYQAAVTHHPQLGRAWSGLGKIAFSQFDFTTAEQHLLEAVKHMANHIGTWHLLAWVYILQNAPGKARAALEKAYEIDRNFGDTHGGLAVVDVMENRDDEARVRIRKARRLMPEGTAALYAEWLLLVKVGDTAGAGALFATTLDQPLPSGQDPRRSLVERKLQELIAARANAGQAPH